MALAAPEMPSMLPTGMPPSALRGCSDGDLLRWEVKPVA